MTPDILALARGITAIAGGHISFLDRPLHPQNNHVTPDGGDQPVFSERL